MPPKKPLLPYLALLCGIGALSFSALFVSWANAPGPVMAFYRIGLATLIMTPFLMRSPWRSVFKKRWLFLFPLAGGFFTALDHAVWNTAILYTSAANATLLNNTAPLWVALTAWIFFKEQLKGAFWIGLAFTMLGAAVVLGNDFLLNPTLGIGGLLALSSGIFYGGYFLVTQRGREQIDTLPYVWLVSFFAAVSLLVMSLVFRMPLTGYSTQTYLAFMGAALISHIFGYLSIGYALGHLSASLVAPSMIAQPVVTALMAIPLLGEVLHPAQWFGGAAVLAGIFIVHKSREASAREISLEESPIDNSIRAAEVIQADESQEQEITTHKYDG
jgi:drug/metabolite transporter (DMT)-like permease